MGQNVCSTEWHGKHGSTVTLENHTKNTVTVTADSTCPWPFPNEDPKKGFTINAGGTQDELLADVPGTYCYSTADTCDDDSKVNPKTVIIG